MSSPRLTSSLLASALIRRAEAQGGFAAVLAKGDATSGAILIILLEKGSNSGLYERVLDSGGGYAWRAVYGASVGEVGEVPQFVAKRLRSDPDLWVLELDVPSAERFAAEMDELR